MTPAARKPEPVPGCVYPTRGDHECGTPATHDLPAGAVSNSEPLPLCDTHAARFLGAAVKRAGTA